jgi:hypothetical protein
MAKKRNYTYHTHHSFTVVKDGSKVTCTTQLYQVGVYGIVNNDSSMQFNWTPSYLVKLEKRLKKDEADGKITDLVLSNQITVNDESGLWKEVA